MDKKVIGIVGRHVINKDDPFEDYYRTGYSYVKQFDLEKVSIKKEQTWEELLQQMTLIWER